jgi:hypothetical protein
MYSEDHTQWDSIRKYRTAYLKYVRASHQANINPLVLGDDEGKTQRVVEDGCSSYWYSCFLMGCKRRTGQDWRPNQAFSTSLLLAYLKSIEYKFSKSVSMEDLNRWVVLGAYSVVTFMVSLQGTEGFLLDLGGLRMHRISQNHNNNYFLIPLMGKVKGEHCDRCHLLPCTFQSDSGLKPYTWIRRLIVSKERQGLSYGPAISDEKGRVLNSSNIDQAMHEVLEELFIHNCDLFPNSVMNKDDIESNYHAFHSFTRSSDTRALNKGLRRDDINLVN